MQPLTIITTYYNEQQLLEEFIGDFFTVQKKYPNLHLIVVDDGSKTFPARDIVQKYDGIQLYTILEDVGFNSHGARNLGVEVSSTYWNLLIDIDYDIKTIDFEKISKLPFDDDTIYFICVNIFIINKDLFMSCYGYDEEYYNIHHGDRIFVNYLKKKFKHEKIMKQPPRVKRGKRVSVDTEEYVITTYEEEMLYNPISNNKRKPEIQKLIDLRYEKEDFESKPILNFKWEKTF